MSPMTTKPGLGVVFMRRGLYCSLAAVLKILPCPAWKAVIASQLGAYKKYQIHMACLLGQLQDLRKKTLFLHLSKHWYVMELNTEFVNYFKGKMGPPRDFKVMLILWVAALIRVPAPSRAGTRGT